MTPFFQLRPSKDKFMIILSLPMIIGPTYQASFFQTCNSYFSKFNQLSVREREKVKERERNKKIERKKIEEEEGR